MDCYECGSAMNVGVKIIALSYALSFGVVLINTSFFTNVHLGKGCYIVHTDNENRVIIRPYDFFVDPNVSFHINLENSVVGIRSDADLDPAFSRDFGVFIFVKSTPRLFDSLTVSEFRLLIAEIDPNFDSDYLVKHLFRD